MVPYEGKKPYAYISYTAEDAHLVMPILEQLAAKGYRIWFDNGTGQQEDKLSALSKSAVVLAFVTANFNGSDGCRRDVYFAAGQSKPVLGIVPEEVQPDKNRLPQIGENRWVCAADFPSEEAFIEGICKCPDLEPCRQNGAAGGTGGGKTGVGSALEWAKRNWRSLGAAVAVLLLLLIGYHTIHFWSTESCTEAAVCRLCGRERAAATGHDWKAADCETPGTCRRCGETQGIALGHQWTDATCQSAAVCSVCGKKSGEKAEHDWLPATCNYPQTCVFCGEVTGTALDHQWQDATYDAPRTCVLCGQTEGEPLERPQSQPQIQLEEGDLVYFGSYEQDNNTGNGKENIRWVVLEVLEDYALLLSEHALDCKPYHSGNGKNITWEESSLRSWLNDEFLDSAFNAGEQMRILQTRVSAQDNPDFGTEAGETTEDYVFLLSIAEVKTYFPDYPDRVCEPTAYAQAQGAFSHADADRGGWWWLRTPGASEDCAASVNSNGILDTEGSAVTGTKGSVRPAIWIQLN